MEVEASEILKVADILYVIYAQMFFLITVGGIAIGLLIRLIKNDLTNLNEKFEERKVHVDRAFEDVSKGLQELNIRLKNSGM